MGFGDALMASGLARGAAARGKRIAFGDGARIIWSAWEREILRLNPNVAPPGAEGAPDLEWIAHYKGHRLYNRPTPERWIWNYDFRPVPGEVFFDDQELSFGRACGGGYVVIEPDVPLKDVADNKRWHKARFVEVAARLLATGREVVQFSRDGSGSPLVPGVRIIVTPTFRHALAALSRAALYIGPEGGLHHGAAAMGVPAVVLFGGFIPPEVTGYAGHTNLFTGGTACGARRPCAHCREAMDAITPQMVVDAAERILA